MAIPQSVLAAFQAKYSTPTLQTLDDQIVRNYYEILLPELDKVFPSPDGKPFALLAQELLDSEMVQVELDSQGPKDAQGRSRLDLTKYRPNLIKASVPSIAKNAKFDYPSRFIQPIINQINEKNGQTEAAQKAAEAKSEGTDAAVQAGDVLEVSATLAGSGGEVYGTGDAGASAA